VKAICLVVAIGLGTVLPVLADDPVDCSSEINSCLDRELKANNTRLNETYQELLKTLRSMEEFNKMPKGLLVDSLRAAQRAWITYRDRNCDFQSRLMYGGTAASSDYLSCKAHDKGTPGRARKGMVVLGKQGLLMLCGRCCGESRSAGERAVACRSPR